MKKTTLLTLLLLLCLGGRAQERYVFAQRDTLELYMDIYDSNPGAETTFQGHPKPVILFIVGGGFVRLSPGDYVYDWFDTLNANGYTVVDIAYRQGMNGYKMGKGLSGLSKASKRFYLSQQMAVEDLFDAVRYLIRNREKLGLDPDNLVLAGSSAGAITALAAENQLLNGQIPDLPEGFRFRGVMSFAGGIIGLDGAPKYPQAPCPTLLLHGTDDKAVAYRKMGLMGRGLWGSKYLASLWKKKGFNNYCIYRFEDRTHDVAAYMNYLWDLEKAFLEQNVILGNPRRIDAVIDDTSLPSWTQVSVNSIYR